MAITVDLDLTSIRVNALLPLTRRFGVQMSKLVILVMHMHDVKHDELTLAGLEFTLFYFVLELKEKSCVVLEIGEE